MPSTVSWALSLTLLLGLGYTLFPLQQSPPATGWQQNELIDFEIIHNSTLVHAISDIEAFYWDDIPHAIVTEERNPEGDYQTNCTVYRIEGTALSSIAHFATFRATSVAVMWIEGRLYFFVTNRGNNQNTFFNSTLYEFDGATLYVRQHIETRDARDAIHFERNGAHFLVIAKYVGYSSIYRWNDSTQRFDCINDMLGPYAYILSWHHVRIDNEDYLLSASENSESSFYYFDGIHATLIREFEFAGEELSAYSWVSWHQQGELYIAAGVRNHPNVIVYRWVTAAHLFVEEATPEAHQAYHIEHFEHQGEHFLHVSNTYNATASSFAVDSFVYHVSATTTRAIHRRHQTLQFTVAQYLPGSRRVVAKHLPVENELRLLAGDSFTSDGHYELPLLMYRETIAGWEPPTLSPSSSPTSFSTPTPSPPSSPIPTPSPGDDDDDDGSDDSSSDENNKGGSNKIEISEVTLAFLIIGIAAASAILGAGAMKIYLARDPSDGYEGFDDNHSVQ